MPMPKPVCRTQLYNKIVQLEVRRTFSGRGMGINSTAHNHHSDSNNNDDNNEIANAYLFRLFSLSCFAGLALLSCDIHTHTPAKKSSANFLLYPFLPHNYSTNYIGHGDGYKCHSPVTLVFSCSCFPFCRFSQHIVSRTLFSVSRDALRFRNDALAETATRKAGNGKRQHNTTNFKRRSGVFIRPLCKSYTTYYNITYYDMIHYDLT